MKKFAFLLIFSFLSLTIVYSQGWIYDLPQEKLEDGSLTFYEIQDTFYDYWEPYDLDKGYYYVDGEKVKAPYYKLFKRWEWYWQSRINPETGEFPDVSALDEYYKNLQENKSPSGNWTAMGPYTSPGGYAGLGRLNCVTFVPGSTTEYYAGAASGGIWYTADDGATWVNLNDSVPVLGVSDILVIDPVVGPDILYIATGDRDGGSLWSLGGQQSNDNNSVGVLKSIDGGATWNTTGLSFTVGQKVRVNRLLMDPNSAYQIMYAATTQGLYKTIDGGVTWTLKTTLAFIDMEFRPTTPHTIYASTEGSSTTSIYLSVDYGNTWNFIVSYTGIRTELAVSYNQPQWVYALVAGTGNGLQGVYKSTTDGASYSLVFDGTLANNNLLGWNCSGGDAGGQGWYDLCIAVDPNAANTIYVGGVNTWKSTDGGLNFNIVNHWTGCGPPSNAQAVHADKHFFAFQNGTSTLFECNDGGLYKTSDGGTSWTHLSSGMAISQIYRLGVGQTNADEIITGLQDNGSKARLGGIWTDIIGGDGFECIVDYTNENIQYGTLYFGDIYLTTNYWFSSSLITGSLPGQGAWCTPYIMDPSNNQTLYVGFSDVWKTTNQGTNWSKISNQGTTDFQSMAIAASNTNYIYAATHSDIYRTTNGGGSAQTWPNINSNLPLSTSNITYISVKNDDPNHVWVSMGGYNNQGVYETTNGGASWVNISAGLPQIPVMCVIQNTQNITDIELYAATDVGVYVKDGGNNWIPFNTGLPNVVVTELEIYYDNITPANSKIYAATYGRGVWSSDLYSLYLVPVADFSGTPTSGLPPLDVVFSDLSLNTITTWAWDFGDGNTSTIQNPLNTYNNPGLYSVQLTVTGPGGSDSITKTDYIQVDYFPPTADFTADVTSGDAPLTVNFTDLSLDTVNTWLWDFGDGNTSGIQHPQHIYNDPGLYTVSLTVTGPGGSDTHTKTDYISVQYAAPTADFIGNPTSGYFPLQVNFTDLTTGVVNAWKWYFGDGTIMTTQNPVHTYSNSGNYTVSLKSTGPGGSDSIAKVNYITVLVGIEELSTDALKIYPNPCNDYLMISSEKPVSSIKMADIMGNIVKDELIQCPAPCERKINMLELHSGIYFCRIIMENGDIVLMKVLKK
jgi:PKD repeat protein